MPQILARMFTLVAALAALTIALLSLKQTNPNDRLSLGLLALACVLCAMGGAAFIIRMRRKGEATRAE